LVHGLLFIQRQACHKDRSPAIRHPPMCPVATQASGSNTFKNRRLIIQPLVGQFAIQRLPSGASVITAPCIQARGKTPTSRRTFPVALMAGQSLASWPLCADTLCPVCLTPVWAIIYSAWTAVVTLVAVRLEFWLPVNLKFTCSL
jgi:hypothetical protein